MAEFELYNRGNKIVVAETAVSSPRRKFFEVTNSPLTVLRPMESRQEVVKEYQTSAPMPVVSDIRIAPRRKCEVQTVKIPEVVEKKNYEFKMKKVSAQLKGCKVEERSVASISLPPLPPINEIKVEEIPLVILPKATSSSSSSPRLKRSQVDIIVTPKEEVIIVQEPVCKQKARSPRKKLMY